MNNMNLLFLGAGHMACSIIDGLLNSRLLSPGQITAIGRDRAKLDPLQTRYGISVRLSGDETAPDADAVILAVPPQTLADAIRTNKKSIPSNALIISVCAGITIEKIRSLLQEKPASPSAAAPSTSSCPVPRIIRVMPNTLGRTGHGFSALCSSDSATADDTACARKLFGSIGEVLLLPEERFNAFTAFSCTGPAYVLAFVQAMIDAGLSCGFSREAARRMVLENLAGTAELLAGTTELPAESTELPAESAALPAGTGPDPSEILEGMQTPGGITEAAVHVLRDEGFPDLISAAVLAGRQRAEELGCHLLP